MIPNRLFRSFPKCIGTLSLLWCWAAMACTASIVDPDASELTDADADPANSSDGSANQESIWGETRLLEGAGTLINPPLDMNLDCDSFSMSGDPAGKAELATPVCMEQPVAETLTGGQDVDCYAIAVIENQLLHMQIRPLLEEHDSLMWHVAVFTVDGKYITHDALTRDFWFVSDVAGAARICINVFNLPDHQNVAYTFQVSDAGEDDHSGRLGEATPFQIGTAVTGIIEISDDQDCFETELEADGIYKLEIFSDANAYYDIAVYPPGEDEPSTQLNTHNLGFLAVASGKHRFCFSVRNKLTGVAYNLTLNFIGADDYGGDTETAEPFELGDPISGSLQMPGDTDCFKTWISKDLTVDISITMITQTYFYIQVSEPNQSGYVYFQYNAEVGGFDTVRDGEYTFCLVAYSNGAWGREYTMDISAL